MGEFRMKDGTIVNLGHVEQVRFDPPAEVVIGFRVGELVLDRDTAARVWWLPRCAHCGELIDPRTHRCVEGCMSDPPATV